MEFLAALVAIIAIDLVLAGDNAIVIALAARNLPTELRRRAVIWGTVGAVAVRAALTIGVLWLLKVPGLLLIGGAILVWIAYRLLTANDDAQPDVPPAMSFWAAMRTIVIADTVMGMENVIAVAGAAQGSMVLVVLGLLISIPIVVWASTMILTWIERFPALLYLGGAALAWTAAQMMLGEAAVQEAMAHQPLWRAAVYVAVIGGVLGIALLRNRRLAASAAR